MGRTPRELLATVSSADIVEMIAFEQLEPFGGMADDWRAGQIAATVANVQRDPKTRPDAFEPADFMPALVDALNIDRAPTLLDDPEAQSALIDRVLFGRT